MGALVVASPLWEASKDKAELDNIQLQNEKIRNEQPVINLNIDASQIKSTEDNRYYISILVTAKNSGSHDQIICFEDPLSKGLTWCPSPEELKTKKYSPDQKRFFDPLVTLSMDSAVAAGFRIHLPPVSAAYIYYDCSKGDKIRYESQAIQGEFYREDHPDHPIKGLFIRAGGTESLEALIALEKKGLYRIGFAARLRKEDQWLDATQENAQLEIMTLKPIWSASTFLLVRDNHDLDQAKANAPAWHVKN